MPSLMNQIERVPVDSLEFYPGNPRVGNVSLIAESLRVNQQYAPIVVQRSTRYVLAGNHTLKAATSLGWHEIDAVFLDVDDEHARKIVLSSNRTADVGTYDDQALAELLEGLDGDYDGTGYDAAFLETLLDGPELLPTAITDPNAVPVLPEEPFSKLGDVWELGPHRLAVGDSTFVDVWDTLCQGQEADLLFTDPPYGMSYGGGRGDNGSGGKGFGQIANDDLTDEALVGLVRDALVTTLSHCKPDSPAYVCFTWRTYTEFAEALRQANMTPKACIVWDKGSIGLSHGHYRPQHEFIFYVQGQWYGDRAQSDVWSVGRDRTGDYDHPTQKPVELIQRALENSSKPGDIVLDAFGGSGSTLIACHTMNRKARLVELDPKYADVICRRYQEHTGDLPVLASTGEPHDFTAELANR